MGGTNIRTCKMFAKHRNVYRSPHKVHVFVIGMILPCLASCLSHLTKTTAMSRDTLSLFTLGLKQVGVLNFIKISQKCQPVCCPQGYKPYRWTDKQDKLRSIDRYKRKTAFYACLQNLIQRRSISGISYQKKKNIIQHEV